MTRLVEGGPSATAGGPSRMFTAGAGGRVRRRTLSLIRWVAIGGQILAVVIVQVWLGFPLPLLPMLLLIALSALVNLLSGVLHRGSIWLEEPAARLFLAYDLVQVSGLLALTGGLANPFAVLILAPVTVSASLLSERSTAALAALAVLLETLLAIWYLPLPWLDEGLHLHPLLLGGVWAGLVLATVFIAAYIASLSAERRALGEALAVTQEALAREQRLASLGGLAAAVAHELGSPLNTIVLAARELAREVPKDSPWRSDIDLLVEESDRCRKLLAELASRPEDEAEDSGSPFHSMPVSVLIESVVEPFRRDGLAIELAARGEGPEPVLMRDPALLHGLGTLVQNAAQFALGKVQVSASWDRSRLEVLVEDDGPGFEPQVLSRLGEPYVSGDPAERRGDTPDEPHMGLGVFIAQTLLGHVGAKLSFRNRPEGGAAVAISWPMHHFERQEQRS